MVAWQKEMPLVEEIGVMIPLVVEEFVPLELRLMPMAQVLELPQLQPPGVSEELVPLVGRMVRLNQAAEELGVPLLPLVVGELVPLEEQQMLIRPMIKVIMPLPLPFVVGVLLVPNALEERQVDIRIEEVPVRVFERVIPYCHHHCYQTRHQ